MANRIDEARRLTAEAIAANPAEAALWSFQAALWEGSGDFAKAEESYTKAMALRHQNQGDRAGRALARLNLDKLDEARKDIDVLKQEAPTQFLSHYADGLLALRQGRLPEAQAALEEAERLNDRFPLTDYQLGLAHLSQEHYAHAEQSLARFLHAAPGSSGGVELMALAKFRLKDYTGAKRLLAPVLAARPDDMMALRLMGETEIALGHAEAGIGLLQNAVSADPKSATAHPDLRLRLSPQSAQPEIWIALVHIPAGDFERAQAAIDRLWKQSADGEAVDSLTGLLKLAQNDLPGARRYLERVLAKKPGDPALSHQLAEIAMREGRPEEARRLYEKALRTNPGHLPTDIELARRDALAGRLDSMAARMDAAIKAHPDALRPRLVRAEFLPKLGQPDRAQMLLEEVQPRETPASPSFWACWSAPSSATARPGGLSPRRKPSRPPRRNRRRPNTCWP